MEMVVAMGFWGCRGVVAWWKGVGFFLWVMWVHGGEGGGLPAVVMVVAMGFGAEISGVAVGWWKGVGFLLWVMWVHGGEGGGLPW